MIEPNVRYEWRAGRSYRADPNEAQEVFVKLKETVGLTPPNIVKEAKKRGSVLHHDFEWDDGLAGHEFRLIQARTMVRAVVEVQIPDNLEDTPEPVNAWINVRNDSGERVYERPKVVVSNPEMLEYAVQEARKYLDAGMRRWSEITHVRRAFSAARKAFDEQIES